MLNGQLKPGYNWQISTENQFILGYTIHQITNDMNTLQAHMGSLKESLGKMPDTLLADAGYGSEENYEYLENNDVEAFVKYQYFHKNRVKSGKQILTESKIFHMIRKVTVIPAQWAGR